MRKTTLLLQPGLVLCLLLCCACAQAQKSFQLEALLRSKASPLLQHILDNPDSFQYQIIYTQINRDRNNQPHFVNYSLHVDRNNYFNPASTVKLPTALVALEKLNTLADKGIDRNTIMLTDSSFPGQTRVSRDTSSTSGYPSIAQYIKKIFLVSDNDAYTRLYEFNGQETLNEQLWKKGYTSVRIVRRFAPATEEGNRHTNGIRFMKDGQVLYQQPPAYDTLHFDYSKQVLVGKGHLDQHDSLVMTPMDFTTHNRLPLEDLQQLLRSVLFPASVSPQQRFHLTVDEYQFLYQYMSQYPSETIHPRYDTTEFFDSYCKFFLFKSGRQKIPPSIRIFNKPGWSYGYLTDAAYIVDFAHKTEFMLSAVIYVNSDGILNDDKYDYDQVGYPFFKEIGEIMYDYELRRHRDHIPDLSKFVMQYDKDK